MRTVDTVVIGAGQAGLATSHHLTAAGRDHVVLERGRLAERWRSERWDSLHLLTPNWMTRLPGFAYGGLDPEGFMSAADTVAFFEAYAASFSPVVEEHTSVESVSGTGEGYLVRTDQGTWRTRNVVVATGACGVPRVPEMAAELHPGITQVTSNRYRNPSSLPDGGVLVVGASSTGVQLADELARAGREVTLAVGDHTRMPRRYRGMDAFWWLEQIGSLEQTIDGHPDPVAAPSAPSIQLVGGPRSRNLDLGTCRAVGVRLAGRLEGVEGTRATFGGHLERDVARSQARMERVLDRADGWATEHGLDGELDEPDRPPPIDAGPTPGRVDLAGEGISTVLWATGFGREYSWLDVPVLDRAGELVHRRGVTPAPGLYVVGLRFQHRRDSNFIDGVGRDAAYVVDHLTGRPDRSTGAPLQSLLR